MAMAPQSKIGIELETAFSGLIYDQQQGSCFSRLALS